MAGTKARTLARGVGWLAVSVLALGTTAPLAPASWLVGAVALLAPRAAWAQGGDEPPPPPPTQDPNAPAAQVAEQWWRYAWHRPEGKVVIGLVVLLTFVRIVVFARGRAKDAAQAGGGGLFGGFFAGKRLQDLIAKGLHEEAGELLLSMGAQGGGPPGDPTREIEAAEQFLRAKRYARAAEIFVRKGHPKRAAEAYVKGGSNDLAAELYEKAGEVERAGDLYAKIKNKPALARLWVNAGKHERAAVVFAEMAHPKEAAEQWEKAGKKDEAVRAYVDAYSLASGSGAGRRAERELGNEHEAKEIFAKVCKLYEELKEWEPYVAFLVKNGRGDAAAEVWRKAGNLPRAAELLKENRHWDAAGRLMKELGREQEALVLFAQARQERGELEKATELYLEAGEYRIAAENLEKVGKTAQAAELYVKMKDVVRAAELYAKIADYPRAAELYEQARQWSPAIFCWEQAGDPKRTAECWEKSGKSLEAGVAWFAAHDPGRAIAVLRKVDKASPDRKDACRLLGICLHETGKLAEAVPLFEEGFGRKIEKDDVEAFYYYAQTLEHLPKEHGKAISAYETIQKLRPGFRDTPRRLAALKGGKPLPPSSIYKDGADDPGSLFHTKRFERPVG